MIDAAFGDCRAAIGSGDGLVRAGGLRSRQPLGPPLVCPDNLPEIPILILDERPRRALLIGNPRIERFIDRLLLSGGAILN